MADVLNCKHCGGKIQVTGYCESCGLKTLYVNKAMNSSKYYYNIGLDKARVRDMSGAKEALKAALKYDKLNIDARNLLGLIYYETGDVVTALSQWVISVNYFSGRNDAKRYIKEVRSNPHRLEAVNNVTRKYNQALTYAKQGDIDLSFIQLKKVLNGNNRFVEGYLLLALLFISENKKDKARKALKRVLKIDRTNHLAIRYLKEIGHTEEEIMSMRDHPDGGFDTDALFIDERSDGGGLSAVGFDGDPMPVGRYKDINFYKYSIAYIVAGIILGIAVTWFLIIPNRDKNADNEARELRVSFSQELADKNVKTSALENEIDDLNTKLDKANREIDSLNTKIATYEEEAVNALTGESKTNMQAAIKFYEDMSYDTAIEYLDKVLEKNEKSDIALYYKGMCYVKKQDTASAKTIFNTLVKECPKSLYLTVAAQYADSSVLPEMSDDQNTDDPLPGIGDDPDDGADTADYQPTDDTVYDDTVYDDETGDGTGDDTVGDDVPSLDE